MTTTPTRADAAVAVIVVHPDGSGTVELAGRVYTLAEADERAARHAGQQLVITHAQHTGQPVRVAACDQHTDHQLLVSPDGAVQPVQPGLRLLTDCELTEPATASRAVRRWLAAGLLALAATAVAVLITGPLAESGSNPPHRTAPVVVAAPPAHARAVAGARPHEASAILPTRRMRTWRPAAAWQARAKAKAAAARRARPNPVPVRPSPFSGRQYQPPASPPQYRLPASASPQNPAKPPGPSVRIYPDPAIDPT